MINFLDAKEAPTFPAVLGRMSEDKRCLLTGVTDQLTYFPVDTNPNNFLPSNMSCIADAIAKEVSYTFSYEVDFWDYRITFETPPVFYDYNQNLIQLVYSQRMHSGDREKYCPVDHKHFTALYEYLTKYHFKGIAKIAGGDIWFDHTQYQGFLLRALAAEKAQASKIISPNLGIVKP